MNDVIVVGTDGSATAQRAVDEALRLTQALGGELHIVSAYEPVSGARISGAPEGAAKIWAPLPDSQVEAALAEAASAARFAGLEATTHALRKDPDDALISIADEVGATLIVVGSQGMHGTKRFTLGNVPNKVSHRARCNVLIVATEAPAGED